jgi:hypothetical protein
MTLHQKIEKKITIPAQFFSFLSFFLSDLWVSKFWRFYFLKERKCFWSNFTLKNRKFPKKFKIVFVTK